MSKKQRRLLEGKGGRLISQRYMRTSMMRLEVVFAISIYAIGLTQAALPFSNPLSNEGAVEQKLSQLFQVTDLNNRIYAVSDSHVLQPLFDKEGELTEIRVVPRHYFNDIHPDWREPDKVPFLDEPGYRHLLSLIQQVRPLGQLKRKDPGSTYITNNRYPAFDEYENCVIERSMLSGRGLPDGIVFPVVSFYIYFLHPVSGHLDSIAKPQPKYESKEFCRVKIDGNMYWIGRKNCGSLKIGNEISIQAAGPPDQSM
jgi:hypothetical protein